MGNYTLLAAEGLTLIMFFAVIFHISRDEIQAIIITFVIGLVSGFIAWGRFKKVPVH